MTPIEAAKVLEIAPDSTPEQIEARFLELRRKLEDKIAKAPTPGLQAKYRETLTEITTAFETLTLAADSSSLPVLQRSSAATPNKLNESATTFSPAATAAARVPTKPRGNKEFILVATICVAVLAGGGWWVMKTRAEAAEKARLEAVAKADAERKVAEEKLAAERKVAEEKVAAENARIAGEKEKARQEQSLARLNASTAEAKVRWDEIEKELTEAERRLSELKSDLRNTRDVPAPQVAELQAQYAAQGDYVEWLQPFIAKNPLRTNLAKLEALLSARAIEDASAVSAEVAKSLDAVEKQVASEKESRLTLTAPVQITSEPDGLAYAYTDAYGRTANGVTPFQGQLPLGALRIEVKRGEGWSDYKRRTQLKRGELLKLAAVFGQGSLQVDSIPKGMAFVARNAAGYFRKGTAPALLADVPSGDVSVRFERSGWPDVVQVGQVLTGGTQTVQAEFVDGAIMLTSEPSGAEVYSAEKKLLGKTPLNLDGQIPGEKTYTLRLKGYCSTSLVGVVRGRETAQARATLKPFSGPSEGEPCLITKLNLTLVPIAPGTFLMGTASGGSDDEHPQTRVTLSKAYWLGQYDVRVKDFRAFVEATGYRTEAEQGDGMVVHENNTWTQKAGASWRSPGLNQDDNHPVVGVSWNDAMAFCAWVNQTQHEAGTLPEGYAYTLPTEAQWEYACRAGTTGDYAGSLDAMGWYNQNSGNTTHPVGQKQPNAWGLYDMHGNVWQWCLDWYGNYPGGSMTDPTGPASGPYRVIRGGGWNNPADYCRSADRGAEAPGNRSSNLGFRLALSSVP